MLADGFHGVPAGKVATVVTHLEMRSSAPLRGRLAPDGVSLRHVPAPDPDWYRALYARVGTNWLWFSRLAMAPGELAAILNDPRVEVYALARDGTDLGLLELDFRMDGACELAFFGLAEPLIGTGAGGWLMDQAIARAWARPITRLHVHTCTLDHPSALGFYLRSGFTAIRQEVEIADDPRNTGLLPAGAAPQIPRI
ncbi:MAG: GNAT family N-acetyltransferase [Marinibacterium sp.]